MNWSNVVNTLIGKKRNVKMMMHPFYQEIRITFYTLIFLKSYYKWKEVKWANS